MNMHNNLNQQTSIKQFGLLAQPGVSILAIANVHGYFKTETHFGNFWLGPHSRTPWLKLKNYITALHIVMSMMWDALSAPSLA